MCQKIVLGKDNGRGDVAHFLDEGVGKALVDTLIFVPVFGTEDGARVGDVAERPEAFVGEAFVITAIFFRGEPDAAQRVGGARRRNLQVIVGVDDFAVGVAGAVGDPGAVAGVENGFEGGDDAAGGDEHLNGVVALVEDVHVGLPVGNDVERVVLEFALEADAEAVGSPERGLRIAQLSLLLGGGARKTQILGEVARFGVNLFEHFVLGERAGAVWNTRTQSTKPVGGVGERRDEIPAHKNEG